AGRQGLQIVVIEAVRVQVLVHLHIGVALQANELARLGLRGRGGEQTGRGHDAGRNGEQGSAHGRPPGELQGRSNRAGPPPDPSISQTPAGIKASRFPLQFPAMPPVLVTDRLVLRPFVEDDARHFLALDSDPEVMRYVGPFRLPDEAAYRARIRDYFLPSYERHPGYAIWPAGEPAPGALVGWVPARPALRHRVAAEAWFQAGDYDVGFRLVRAAWGRGYATEVTRALVTQAVADAGVEAVVACVLTTNRASVRVLEKAGLRLV